MSWSVPNQPQAQSQWNPAMVMQIQEHSGYTPEQWAIMQQQNWHQWTQWQQQYSQWQNQYGDKYAQQVQAVQGMGGMPPLPPSGAAPPPPPPDKPPPPPPPHENNQPLYHSDKSTATPAPAPQQHRSNLNSISETGNNPWSYSADPLPAVNAEALKKLAEEERLFDIQFQKWEEEIDKWRQENINHPDKQAYKDYEAKFEACRKQLLERRQQMKTKRASLLNNPASLNTGNTLTVPQPQNANTNSNQKQQTINSQNKSYERQFDPKSNNKNIEPQDRYESYQKGGSDYRSQENHAPQGHKTDNSTFLPSTSSSKGIPGLDLVPDTRASKKQDIVDLSDDKLDVKQKGKAPDFSTITMGINNILGDEKIMNILRGMNPNQVNAVENTMNNSNNHQFPANQGNRNQNFNQPYLDSHKMVTNNRPGQFPMLNHHNQSGNFNRQDVMQQDQYHDLNNQYAGSNRGGPNIRGGPGGSGGPSGSPYRPGMQQGGPGIRPGGPGMHQGGQGIRPPGPGMQALGIRQGGPNMQHGGPSMLHGGPNMQQGGPNMQQGGPNMQQGGTNMHQGGTNVHQGGTNVHQGAPNMQQGGPNMQQGGPNKQQGSANVHQGGPNMPPSKIQQGDLNMQNCAQNRQQPQPLMGSRISLPNMQPNNALARPPLQDTLSQQNADFFGAQRLMPPPPPTETPKPQWKEDPLFNPSIVVEYEHKSLRIKAREFIEPVHTFDYNHISKDDEIKKKNFEQEAENLFTRKPVRSDREFTEDRFRDHGSRDLYQRDYERRVQRGDSRDIRDVRGESRDMRDREPRDYKGEPGIREARDYRDTREPRDFKDNREPRYFRDGREPRDFRDNTQPDTRESRDFRESRDTREPRDFRDVREPKAEIRVRDDLREWTRDDIERRNEERDELDRHGNRRVVSDDQGRFPREAHRRDGRRDDRVRSTSRERESRKRLSSRESDVSVQSKKPKEVNDNSQKHPLVMIDDILEPPGRDMRPEKIVIILRGLPGSGKTYLAKLIRDRETEHGGTARILSIDDYFMHESEIEETDPATGKTVKKPSLKYEFDESLEETYTKSLKRAFKRCLTDGYYSFLIYDAPNVTLHSYAEIWNFARQNGFQVYICSMEQDIQTCFKRNIHNRTLEDVEVMASRLFRTPEHHIQLDATTLLQSAAITDVHMEDVDDVLMEDVPELQVESVFTSKWEKMDDANRLARLDGTSKPLRPSQLSMVDYLQLDEWTPSTAKPGKKTVRWADIEERREQEKIRAIGFVVGQTDWSRMTDPTMGSSALTQTKYIERVRRN